MIGYHSVSVLADAVAKGLPLDKEEVLKAMVSSSTIPYLDGTGEYMEKGYVALDHNGSAASLTLEYAYDDFALAQMAKALGKTDDYQVLIRRAANYRNVIDPRTGYAQGRHADGTFLNDANAFNFARFITEGAPCHYTWYVPQDPYGLMASMGGKDKYVAKLDSMFSEQRYWHGNEPCHQVAYMFNYAGEPWKTQRAVRHVMETEYLNEPGGLSGNDDAGQMSAWYVLAAAGLHPACPGDTRMEITSPVFDRIELRLDPAYAPGGTFTVVAHGNSPSNVYIQRAVLNGREHTASHIDFADIAAGGTLELYMGDTPNTRWGI